MPDRWISVGIQFDTRYTTSRLMKKASHSSNVPRRRPPPKSWRTGETCRRGGADEAHAREVRCRRDPLQRRGDSGVVIVLRDQVAHRFREQQREHRREQDGRTPPPTSSGRQP